MSDVAKSSSLMDSPVLLHSNQVAPGTGSRFLCSESPCWESLNFPPFSLTWSFSLPCLMSAQMRYSESSALFPPWFHGNKTHVPIRSLLKDLGSSHGGKLYCPKMENKAPLLSIPSTGAALPRPFPSTSGSYQLCSLSPHCLPVSCSLASNL